MKSLLIAAATAVGALAVSNPSAAADPDKLQQVRVETSRIVTTEAGKSYTGLPMSNVSLTYEVSLDDLNLATAAGAATAEKRIQTAAAAACDEIEKAHPSGSLSNAECAKKAAAGPLTKVRAAVAAAQKTTSN